MSAQFVVNELDAENRSVLTSPLEPRVPCKVHASLCVHRNLTSLAAMLGRSQLQQLTLCPACVHVHTHSPKLATCGKLLMENLMPRAKSLWNKPIFGHNTCDSLWASSSLPEAYGSQHRINQTPSSAAPAPRMRFSVTLCWKAKQHSVLQPHSFGWVNSTVLFGG